ncbi:MAG: NnrS family protein [Gammaproteobacteria bacterium]|nr:NnrS family protein [Gammaproteobacteria bacterium]
MSGQPWTILNYAFRPFFLLGACFSVLALFLWVVSLHGGSWAAARPEPVLWHAHEMLIGFALAAIAGFLLTAVATWTGRPQLSGPLLGTLVGGWVLGRIAMTPGVPLPASAVAIADMCFPLLLALLAIREIVGGASRRNYGIATALALVALCNLVFHLGRASLWPGADGPAVLLAAYLILLLITLIAGRIVPSFTANWLRLQGRNNLPVIRPWVEKAILPMTGAAGIADTLATNGADLPAVPLGTVLLATGFLHALRLSGWRGTTTRPEPLLSVLHVGYAWLPIGFLLLGLTTLGLPLPRSAALHALTMGGIGVMVLAVTTRVALGHTGRPLRAAPATVAAYVALNAAVLVRILSPVAPDSYLRLIDIAASGWFAAFALFVWVYGPMLIRPRIDGRPERR